MVSVVSGGGLGWVNSSRGTLGTAGELGQAAQGRAGELVTVNATNGNLVVQNQDGLLVGAGADIQLLRTYNSLGGWDGDNGDAWRLGYYRRLGSFTGTLNTAGSTLVRTDADGFESTYTWREGRYVSSDGAGAYDTLVLNGGTATWTDGDTGRTEIYTAIADGSYRLIQITDPEGHSVRIGYDAQGLISGLATATDTLTLVYDSNRRLTQVSSRTQNADGSLAQQTRVYYTYDTAGRLASVVTDLSPEDGSITDGRSYSVNYGYDALGRLRTLTQTDSTALTVDYDALGRVRQITDALNHSTTFDYSTPGQTSVTDALGQVARLAYDTAGRLGELSGTGFKTSFAYDADGNLRSSTNGLGQQTLFGYDTQGHLIRSTDASGRVQEFGYDGGLQTSSTAAAQTTRYVYDTTGGLRRLRFTLSAEGRVTEQQYNALGQLTSSLSYTRSAYSGAANLAELSSWAGQQGGVQRADYRYDLRGQLASRTDASGLTRFTYDPFGRLLQTIDANGRTTAYAYDGLDRLLLSTDALGNHTVTSYDDAGYRTSVTAANGLRSVNTYNRAGLLVSQAQYNGSTVLGDTRYSYDADNRLRMTQGPTGQRQWRVYDEAGRLTGEIDALGHLTEYRYDAAGRLVQTIGYEQAVNTALLLDAQGQPTTASLASLRPATSANDRRQWQLFDAAGRLTHQIDSLGDVTETVYDAAGRVSSVIQHGQRLSSLPSTDVLTLAYSPAGDPDRISRNFYDADGLLRATLDAEGYFTELRYDAAGQIVEHIAYARATEAAQRATGTQAQLTPTTHPADRHTLWFYDPQGRQVGEIDPDGWLTETTYNTAGQRIQTQRYARRVSPGATSSSTLASLRPTSTAEDQRSSWTYDALNRLQTETAPDGSVTRYAYDSVGNLTSTERAAGTADARLITRRYDLLGRLTAELSPEGSAKLVQAITPTQIEAIWATTATQHAYNAAGQRIRSTDPLGHVTVYYFDAAGQLTYTIQKTDQGGEVQARRYNGFGETSTQIRYTRRLSLADTAALTGGQTDAALDAKIATLADGTESRIQALYNQRGQIQQAIDALGFKTSTAYNAFGQLSRSDADVGDSRIQRTDYGYDRRGLLTAISQDPLGLNAQTRTEYDAFGRVTAQVDARGNRTTTAYLQSDGAPDSGRQIVLTDALGARSTTTYDAFDRTLRQTDALGYTTTFSHDTAHHRVTMTSPTGIVTTTETNPHGQTTKFTDGTGATTTYRFEKNGNLLSRTDPLGHVTQNTYDAADHLLTQTGPDGTVTRYSYDAANRVLTRQVDPNGLNLSTRYEYDGQGRAVKITDPAGSITSYRFDAQGQLLDTVVDDTPGGLKLKTSSTYDAQGRVLSVTQAAGTTAAKATEYRYDILGRLSQQIVDPAGLKLSTSYEYDATGNVVLKRDLLGAVTRYAHDAEGRQTFSVDALGAVTETQYDATGRVVQTTQYATAIKLPAAGATDAKTVVLGGDAGYVTGSNFAAIDTSKTYKVRVRLRQLSGTGLVYAGVGVKNAAGNDIVNSYAGTFSYAAASGVLLTPEMGWVTYEGLITGETALNASADRNKFFVGAKSATPLLLYNYYGSNADPSRLVEVDSLELIDVATGTVLNTSADMSAGAASLSIHNGSVAGAYTSGNPALSAAEIRTLVRPSAAQDRITRYAYDADGRQVFSVDALGAVTECRYDAAGRVLQTTQYATAIKLPAAGATDAKTVVLAGDAGYVTGGNFAAIDTSKTYKVRVRLRQLSGTGLVYAGVDVKDGAGNKIVNSYAGTFSYAAASGVSLTPEMGWVTYEGLITGETALNAAADRNKFFVGTKSATPLLLYNYYGSNADPRRLVEVDSLELIDVATGAVLNTSADMSAGAASLSIQSGAVAGAYTSAAATLSTVEIRALVRPAAAQDRTTRYTYDAAGRQTLRVDALGAAIETKYDAAGQVVQTTQYADTLPAGGAMQVWHRAGTNSSAARRLGSFKAGDVVTATVRFKTAANTTGMVFLGDAGGSDPYDNMVQLAIEGDDGWQTLQVSVTLKHDDLLWIYVYGDRDGAYADDSHNVLYDNVQVTSTQTGLVLAEDFSRPESVAQWDISGQAQHVVTTRSEAYSNAALLQRVRALAAPGRDRVTRYTYDAAGRQILSVDALGTVTETQYDAAGRVVQSIQYADTLPAGGAMQVWHRTGTNSSASRGLGSFKAGDVVTATVRFKASPDAVGMVFLGDAGGPDPYDNMVQHMIYGDDGWQTLQVSVTLKHDDSLDLYLYGDRDGVYASDTHSVLYDNVQVTSVQKGVVLAEDFSRPESVALWSVSGQALRVVTAPSDAYSDAALLQRVHDLTSPSRDRVTRYGYDVEGRAILRVDPQGAVTETQYDVFGHAKKTTQYASTLPAGGAMQVWHRAGTNSSAARGLGSFKAGDLVTATLRFKAPPNTSGMVFLGDAGGPDPYDNAVMHTIYGDDGWQTLQVSVTLKHDDQLWIYVYGDRDGAYTDDSHSVLYDNVQVTSAQNGLVLAEDFSRPESVALWGISGQAQHVVTAPSEAYSDTALLQRMHDLAAPTRDRTTRTVYDPAGHPAYQQDALGYVTKTRYNATGQVIEQIHYANPIALTTAPTQAAFDAALVSDSSFDRPTRYVYDAAGQLRFSVDALGGVVETVYDAQGQIARTIAYDAPVAYSRVGDTSSPEAVRALLPTSSLAARETIYTYDATGHLVHTARAQTSSNGVKTFTVTENQYDAQGQVIRQVAYSTAVALQNLPAVVTVAQLASRLAAVANPAADRSTRLVYDAAGQLIQRVDGEGYGEQYVYDAWGHKTRYTNKNGAVFDYEYDSAGRLLAEWSPAVAVTRLDAALNPLTETQRLQTRLSYDAWGQLISRTEAYGRPEARTSRYEYDALGRQVRSVSDPVAVYDASADNLASNGVSGAAVSRTETQRALTTDTVYDAFGQAVIQRDVSGHYSYRSYDALGRLVTDINANHQVTQTQYSTRDGEYTQTTRLANVASFADGATVSADSVNAAVTAASAGGARSLRSYLDRLGRTQRVEDLLDAVYSYDGTAGQGGNWVRATTYDYTVWGDLKTQSTLLDRAAGSNRSATTSYLYDLQGSLSRQVDAEGYVTEHSRNAFRDDSHVTEYAARLDVNAVGAGGTVTATTASANPSSAIGQDRTRVISYDRRGLKLSEQQQDTLLGVRTADLQADQRAAHVRTEYQYDGQGQLLAVVSNAYDARSGALLQSAAPLQNFYDALGRLSTTVQTGRATSVQYDALGQAVLSTRYANLAMVSGTGASRTLSLPSPSADDQITRQVFDAQGHVIRRRDAMDAEQFFSYDAAGHVAKQWQPFADADGRALNAVQLFSYDKLGRQVDTRTLLQREAGAGATYSSESVQYNTFGEITARLRDENMADSVAAVQVAYYDYDGGGRLWRSNEGTGAEDGVDKIYLYDLQDKVSAVITSPTLDLRSFARAQDVPTTLAAGTRTTISRYDRLGHLVDQRDPSVTHLDGSTSARWVRQSYDAWGNTLSATTSLGYTTNYRYNALNQVVEQKLPTTTYLTDHNTRGDSDPNNDIAGVATTGRPSSTVYIDAWGRTLGSTDARGNTSTQSYTATGELEYEYHADGGVVRHTYDNLGREVKRYTAGWNSGDPNSRLYNYSYDRLNRKTGETVFGRWLFHANGTDDNPASFTWSWNTYTLGSYSYDALGHRISETSGGADKRADITTRYYFDTAGRLLKSSTPLQTLQYTFNAAGHTLAETDALGQTTRYSYNPQGRLLSKLDIGGATTQFTYDRTGALLTQTNDRGQNLAYTYYDDGRLKTVRDLWADSLSTYDYDADAHMTVDRFVTGASTASPGKYRDVAMGYDELGRLRSVTDTARGTGTLADYELTIQYDANGNRARVQGSARDNDLMVELDERFGMPVSRDTDGLARRKIDQSFAYDAMNRQTGQRELSYNGSTEVLLWKFFNYDKDGNRTSEEQRFANTGKAGELTGRVVKYNYDFADRVAEANVISKTSNGAGADVLGTERQHRKVIYAPWGTGGGYTQEWQWAKTSAVDSLAYADQAPDRVYTTETYVNANQAVTQVVGRLKVGTGAWYLTSNQLYTLDAAGNLASMHVDSYQAQSASLASTLDYTYTYLKMDGYLQRSARVVGKQWNGAQLLAVTPVTTSQDYDVNGRLVQVFDDNSASLLAEQFIITDTSGHIVMKAQYRASAAMAAHVATGTYDPVTGAHGKTAGTSVTAAPAQPSLRSYRASNGGIASVNMQRVRYANGQIIGTTDETSSMRAITWYDGPEKFTTYEDTFSTSMRASDAWSAANVNVSATGALQYTWNSGDTLRGLAQTFYGDASLWYVIAEANGYVDESEIVAGTVLSLPNVTRDTNTASTAKVYNPTQIIGETNPAPIPPPPPPPPRDSGCGGFGAILVIVVAVVVTAVTGGAAIAALGPTLGSVGAAVVGGAAGAAAGSIASQGVGIAIGQQQEFSWKAVGQAGLSGAIGGGLGASGLNVGGQVFEAGTWQAAAANAVAATGANLAVHGDWSWKQILASAVSAGLGGDPTLVGGTGAGWTTAAALGSRFAGNWLSSRIIQGQADPRGAWAQTLGQTLGNSIAISLQPQGLYAQGYRNGADMDSDRYHPAAAYNYRNGSDVDSDTAYDDRRAREWSDQNDAILGRRANDALAASQTLDKSLRDQTLGMANFNATARQVWTQEDAQAMLDARAGLAGQHTRADAYGRELARQAERAREEQLYASIYAAQMRGGPRGGRSVSMTLRHPRSLI